MKGFEYSRTNNPTRGSFEKAVASLENAKFGVAFASGCATTTSITTMLGGGSHIVSVNDVYGGTYRYFNRIASTLGVEVTFCDLDDPSVLRQHLRPNTKMVWIESPTNPTLKLTDIKAIADIVKERPETILVVDNTFLSPYFQNPLDLGADIVIHSVTKYLNGHCDTVMGIALTNTEEIYTKLKFLQNSMGAIPSPFDSYLASRGLKTLHVRMKRHEENAFACAKFLESSPYVEKVLYPGLPSHPQHKIALKQQKGFGGMVSFYIKGGLEESSKFLSSLNYITLAESLGGTESLAELPCIMTHGSVSSEDRAKLGITDALIRFSVGLEDSEDLIEDLQQALEKAVKKSN